MTVTVDVLVAGLPAGPATEARVRSLLGLAADDDEFDSFLESAINAVNEMVVGWPCSEAFIGGLPPVDEREDIKWPWRLTQGASMLAGRIFTRRNSIEGVVTFGVEGVAYVQRNDPEIAQLLNLGQNRIPKVG